MAIVSLAFILFIFTLFYGLKEKKIQNKLEAGIWFAAVLTLVLITMAQDLVI
ncbi:MAG: hypothetical protein K1X55_15640 [Chitinophagales bacterium]|nr:hypothetical protein [Chitinophagales bacterium]